MTSSSSSSSPPQSSSENTRMMTELYERLYSIGVKVTAVEKWKLSEEQLSELVDKLEHLLDSAEAEVES